MSRHIRNGLSVALLALIGLAIAGCETPNAKPAALTGDQNAPVQHERHSTGIESQARDM